MSLEHKINEESFNEMNEAVQAHYEKDGESYFLQAVGMSPKAKVDEFRSLNIDLKKSNETQKTTIEDLNGKLTVAQEGSSDDKIKQMVEAQLGKRTKTMTEEHASALTGMTTRAETAESSLSSLLVNDAVNREAISAGVKDTALIDVLTRASKVFKVVSGKATPYDGEDIIYGKDGTTPLTVKDWLAGQAAIAPHLFKESTGSGATNKDKSGGATVKTISRSAFDAKNPAEKMEFVKSGGKLTD